MNIKKTKKTLYHIISRCFERYNWARDIENALIECGFKNTYGCSEDESIWYNSKAQILLLLNWIDSVIYAYHYAGYKISSELIILEEIIEEYHSTDILYDRLSEIGYQPLYTHKKVWIPKKYPYLILFEINRGNCDFYTQLDVFDMDGTKSFGKSKKTIVFIKIHGKKRIISYDIFFPTTNPLNFLIHSHFIYYDK